MGLANWLQSLVFASTVVVCYYEKMVTQLSFIAFQWQTGLLQVCDRRRGCIWRRLWAYILWGKTETGGGFKSNQVKRLGYSQCFNVS